MTTKPELVAQLRAAGYTGPVSYDRATLEDMWQQHERGEEITGGWRHERGTKQPREPKGVWMQVEEATLPEDWESRDAEFRRVSVMTAGEDGEPVEGVTIFEQFVPEPKKEPKTPRGPRVVKPKLGRGDWVECERPELPDDWATDSPYFQGPAGEAGEAGTWYHVDAAQVGADETPTLVWERFVPYVKPPKAERAPKGAAGQEEEFDPRALLRVFENFDLRDKTGGYDVTHTPIEDIEAALAKARVDASSTAVVPLQGGSGDQTARIDVTWLESLLAVKLRLRTREALASE